MASFDGRYYTRNGEVVAVHKCGYISMGHILKLEAPYIDNRGFVWSDRGNCLEVSNGEDITTYPSDTVPWDLLNRVNPQGQEDTIECVDCPECREYQAAKRGAAKGAEHGTR